MGRIVLLGAGAAMFALPLISQIWTIGFIPFGIITIGLSIFFNRIWEINLKKGIITLGPDVREAANDLIAVFAKEIESKIDKTPVPEPITQEKKVKAKAYIEASKQYAQQNIESAKTTDQIANLMSEMVAGTALTANQVVLTSGGQPPFPAEDLYEWIKSAKATEPFDFSKWIVPGIMERPPDEA